MIEGCKITVCSGITTIRFSVAPTSQEVQRVIDELVDNYPSEYRLWDFSNVRFAFSKDEIRTIAEYNRE